MEDVVETLLGIEIVDESDETEDLQLLARQSWERRASRLGLQLDGSERRQPPEADVKGDVVAAADPLHDKVD